MTEERQLLPVTMGDVDHLHGLACQPLVYRYLFDGEPPTRRFIEQRVAQAIANFAYAGLGMWVLEQSNAPCAGCVELRPYPSPRAAEITYLLHPESWGQGLALRMAWTAIAYALRTRAIDTIIAGHDLPNTVSSEVMRRLGMRFHKSVEYPLGPGAEYILRRDDAGPMPRPVPMILR